MSRKPPEKAPIRLPKTGLKFVKGEAGNERQGEITHKRQNAKELETHLKPYENTKQNAKQNGRDYLEEFKIHSLQPLVSRG